MCYVGYRVQGDSIPIMENQMDKKTEIENETSGSLNPKP